MDTLTRVLDEVRAERERQDAKWGGVKHDDSERPESWVEYIIAYATWAKMMWTMGGESGRTKYRRRMMQVAALAVAACEAFDRVGVARSTEASIVYGIGGWERNQTEEGEGL